MFRRVIILAALAACVEPSDPADTLGETSAALRCHDWGCTGNSPVMGPYASHEFHTGGLANSEGLRVDGFWIGGLRYTPIVDGYRLTAKRGATIKADHQLVNGYFKVIHDASNTEFRIIVKSMSISVTFWLGDADLVPTYELSYVQPPAVTQVPLCANPPASLDPSIVPAAWSRPFEAILFTGDRYDSAKKSVWAVEGNVVKGWFNIACAGSALAKLHLNRYTTAGAKGTFTTTPAERQSLLNAFTANLCGDGWAYTDPGTPLRWRDSAGRKPALAPAWDLEAVWGPAGAVCIDDAYRVPWVDPASACLPALRSCDMIPGYDEASWQSWGLVRTAIP